MKITTQQLDWIVTIGYKKFIVKDIAEKVGLKPCTVTCILKKHNLKATTIREIATKKLIAMHNSGKIISKRSAAKQLGISEIIIREIMDKHNLQATGSKSIAVSLNRHGRQPKPIKKVKQLKQVRHRKKGVKYNRTKKGANQILNEKLQQLKDMLKKQNRPKW